MTQDAGLMVKEQGAWLHINVGTSDAPKVLKLKLIPADFEELNAINTKIVEAGKPIKGAKDSSFNADVFTNEVVKMIAPHIVDWNLIDENGPIECNDANKVKQIGRFLIAFTTIDPKEGDVIIDGAKPEKKTALTMIMEFIGDYSNFLEA